MTVPNFETKEEFEAYLANPKKTDHTHTLRMIRAKWLPKLVGFGVVALVLFFFYPKWGEVSPGRKATGSILHSVLEFCGYDTSILRGHNDLAVPNMDQSESPYASFR